MASSAGQTNKYKGSFKTNSTFCEIFMYILTFLLFN